MLYLSILLKSMCHKDHSVVAGQLCGGVRAVGRDAGQRLSAGHRGQHTEGDDQATQHPPHRCE